MTAPAVTVAGLLEARPESLGLPLDLLAGASGLGRRITNPYIQKTGLALAGFHEYLHAGRVRFVKLNIDDNFVTASRYDVLSIPTAILFDGGESQEAVIGERPRSHFERAWERWLGPEP